jgi:hypothetical protein
MTDVTVTNDPPAANTSEARTTDGTLIDQSASTTPSPTDQKPSTEGDSFLTGKDAPKPEAAAAPKADGGLTTVPEKYEDFKVPDGYAFDPESLSAATTLFKDIGLSQEAAQKAVDFYAQNALQAAKAPYDAWSNLQKEWLGEINDRFPGESANKVRGMINGVVANILPPSLAKNFSRALDITGAGTNPDVVEALSILLKPLSEGTPVRGIGPSKEGQAAPGAAPPSIADALYGHLRK